MTAAYLLIVTMLNGDIVRLPKANYYECELSKAHIMLSQARVKNAMCVKQEQRDT